MTAKDPELAEQYISQAKKMGKSVVSKNNPGYSSNAVRRRLMNTSKKKEQSSNNDEHDYRDLEKDSMANRNKMGY